MCRFGANGGHVEGEREAERRENMQGVHGRRGQHRVPAMWTLCLLRRVFTAAADMSNLSCLHQRHCGGFGVMNSTRIRADSYSTYLLNWYMYCYLINLCSSVSTTDS